MDLNESELLHNLRNIDEYKFESFIADLWQRQGWDTTVSQDSNDRGIDVIAEKNTPFSQKHLIQVKKYKEGNKIGVREIREYSSLSQRNNVDAVIVVTTSSFTRQARNEGDSLNVKLVSGAELCDIIAETNSIDIVKEYTDIHDSPELDTADTQDPPELDTADTQDQVKRLKEQAKEGEWNTGSSGSTASGRSSAEKQVKIDDACPRCNSAIGWYITRDIGKCTECGQKYKYINDEWIGLSNGELEKKRSSNPHNISENRRDESQKVKNTSDKTADQSGDNILEQLAQIVILILFISIFHSLISLSFHSYQFWLLIGLILLGVANGLIKLILRTVAQSKKAR